MAKVLYLNKFNGSLPAKTCAYQTGWRVVSHYESQNHLTSELTEAEAFKLLGEALEHYELIGTAIKNLRSLLGIKE